MTATIMTTADTAKMIRSALKAAFPTVTFSVKSIETTLDSTVRIKWTAGPEVAAVRAVVDQYQGADFNSDIDMRVSRGVVTGADYISYRRTA